MAVEQLVYTDRERGAGVEPNSAGYQIAACSKQLDDATRKLLSNICLHYGQVVYRNAPREMLDLESRWRSETKTLDAVPAEILDQFPLVWSYDRVGEDLYAFTGIRYAGLTHDKRVGNFLAHSLIFRPETLAAQDYNPAASRNLQLCFSIDFNNTVLPSLSDLGQHQPDSASRELLAEDPYADCLPELITALCTASPTTRPLVICLSDWRTAAPLVEGLLALLPPSSRCRKTFCTFEGDRTWVPSTSAGRAAGAAAHHLLVLWGKDDRAFSLRPDEYQSQYAVFNFVGNQFSSVAPSGYGQFAATCVRNGKSAELEWLHALIENFGVGQETAAWDGLTSAAHLHKENAELPNLVEALNSITPLVNQPGRATFVFERLMPHLRQLSDHNASSALTQLAPNVGAIADQLPDDSEADYRNEVHKLAAQSFAAGRTCTAKELLAASGKSYDEYLLRILRDSLSQNQLPEPAVAEDQLQLIEFLSQALLGEASADVADLADRMLVAAFQTAAAAGATQDVWPRLAEYVEQRLKAGWGQAELTLAQQLVRHLTPENCPLASVYLHLRRLEGASDSFKKLDDLSATLVVASRAAARCEEGEELLKRLRAVATNRVTDPLRQAVVLGLMAEPTAGTKFEENMAAAFRKTSQECLDKISELRNLLAERHAVQVLWRDLLTELLPWKTETSSHRLGAWKLALTGNPKFLDHVCDQTAGLLARGANEMEALPLAEAIVAQTQSAGLRTDSARELLAALIKSLPLRPISKTQARLFKSNPADLQPEARARFELLELLGKIEQDAGKPGWSIKDFPHKSSAWCEENFRKLSTAQKGEAWDWCLATFSQVGISTPDDAEGLVQIMNSIDVISVSKLVEALDQMLHERDPVTHVVVAMAFAGCHLEGRNSRVSWSRAVAAIVKRYDKNTLRLFQRHLEGRFCRLTREYHERLLELCKELGLSKVNLPEPPEPEEPPPVTDQSEEQPAKRSWLGWKKR